MCNAWIPRLMWYVPVIAIWKQDQYDCVNDNFLLLLQRYMDSEIRAIMAQYMPLDNQGEIPNHVPHGDIQTIGVADGGR